MWQRQGRCGGDRCGRDENKVSPASLLRPLWWFFHFGCGNEKLCSCYDFVGTDPTNCRHFLNRRHVHMQTSHVSLPLPLPFSIFTATLSVLSRPETRTTHSQREFAGQLINRGKMGSNLETRSLMDEIRNFDKQFGGLFDLGHPLLNRIAESFVKAAGIGAVQAVSREAYFTALESAGGDNTNLPPEITTAPKKHSRFPDLRGETNRKSVEALVKSTGKESIQWGLAAGMFSGLTYGLKEARGVHDWKNSAVAGAITGAALALTLDDASHENIVQCAITGAAITTAANLLTGIF